MHALARAVAPVQSKDQEVRLVWLVHLDSILMEATLLDVWIVLPVLTQLLVLVLARPVHVVPNRTPHKVIVFFVDLDSLLLLALPAKIVPTTNTLPIQEPAHVLLVVLVWKSTLARLDVHSVLSMSIRLEMELASLVLLVSSLPLLDLISVSLAHVVSRLEVQAVFSVKEENSVLQDLRARAVPTIKFQQPVPAVVLPADLELDQILPVLTVPFAQPISSLLEVSVFLALLVPTLLDLEQASA